MAEIKSQKAQELMSTNKTMLLAIDNNKDITGPILKIKSYQINGDHIKKGYNIPV